jgi:hypothetical protein
VLLGQHPAQAITAAPARAIGDLAPPRAGVQCVTGHARLSVEGVAGHTTERAARYRSRPAQSSITSLPLPVTPGPTGPTARPAGPTRHAGERYMQPALDLAHLKDLIAERHLLTLSRP